jgi:predicted RNA-binding Zn-ribbon protein involved in translation (DUF1610 family)
MHERRTERSTNLLQLISWFKGISYQTDYRDEFSVIKNARVLNRTFKDASEAANYAASQSYGSDSACVVMHAPGKITKAFTAAFESFTTRKKEYEDFERNLTIGYGRKSSKVTCPNCGSSISLRYGSRFKACPICTSKKIISDSNWKTLETKEKLMEKANNLLQKEASKVGVEFVGGFEWHC